MALAAAARPEIGNGESDDADDVSERSALEAAGTSGLPAVDVVTNVLGGTTGPEARNVLVNYDYCSMRFAVHPQFASEFQKLNPAKKP